MCDITSRLRKTIEDIPDDVQPITLSDLKEIGKSFTRYHLDSGKFANSRSLLSLPEIKIALTEVSEGGRFPFHVHKAPTMYELIIVVKGVLKMTIGKQVKLLDEMAFVKIDRDVKHDAVAIKDAMIVAITIPADYGFPE